MFNGMSSIFNATVQNILKENKKSKVILSHFDGGFIFELARFWFNFRLCLWSIRNVFGLNGQI